MIDFVVDDLEKTHPNLKVANCAECHELITAEFCGPVPRIAGRIKGRPYCPKCLSPRHKRIEENCMPATPDDGASPWQENAIRAMEDCPVCEDLLRY